jgi:hypothetical protein
LNIRNLDIGLISALKCHVNLAFGEPTAYREMLPVEASMGFIAGH